MRNIPTVLFQDDDLNVVPESALVMFFANYVLSPSVIKLGKYDKKLIPYWGYKELGGLHPCRFTADKNVLLKYNVDLNKNFFLIRLVSLKAVHDINKKGLTNDDVHIIINMLLNHGNVYFHQKENYP
jgi:predicted glycosyltransferase